MVGPHAILLIVTVGQRFADFDPLFRGLGRRNVGFGIAITVVEDAKGDRHHVQPVQVTILAQRVMRGAQIGDVVAGEHIIKGQEQVGLDQARRQFRRGHHDVAVELARLRTDDGLGGIGVKRNVLGYNLNLLLRFVKLLDKGFPGGAAVAFFKPPGEVAHGLFGTGVHRGRA